MHMTITFPTDGTPRVEIDGVDISRHILRDGFSITPGEPIGQALVHMTLRPPTLVVDGEVVDPKPLAVALGQAQADRS